MHRSKFAQEFYNSVLNEGADKWEMNVLYNQFLRELSRKRDDSIVYFCDESNNLV